MSQKSTGQQTRDAPAAVSHGHYDLGQVVLSSRDFPFLKFQAKASKIPRVTERRKREKDN